MPDRHRERPLSLRLGAERQPLEDYARDTGQPVRRVIADAVKAQLGRTGGKPVSLTEVYADLRQLIADYADDERGVIALMLFEASLDQLFHEKYGLELPGG